MHDTLTNDELATITGGIAPKPQPKILYYEDLDSRRMLPWFKVTPSGVERLIDRPL